MPQETGNTRFHLHYTVLELLGFAKKKTQNKPKPIPNPHLKQWGPVKREILVFPQFPLHGLTYEALEMQDGTSTWLQD